jgi:uncharacterized protein YyaL (SSP411 family)
MNRLREAASPYLRQHADNPVEWFEWGEEAFAEAKRRDVPLFISVGYASCHWCHVMAHESFEDDHIAELLNRHYVAIKVDREERPDVDAVYMAAVQALSGHGGWPMNVFATPQGEPFFAGTYWPKDDRQGMPGLRRVLESVAHAWQNRRDEVTRSADQLTGAVRQVVAHGEQPGSVSADTVAQAAAEAVGDYDDQRGGFGQAPKFPQAMLIDFLLAHHVRTGDQRARDAAVGSLSAMARGGIRDHVGGGFHRYSVDADWLVPHFEKMAYDNALLLRAYTHGWQVTGDARLREVAVDTADYLLRELRDERGGFYSSTDADSEGVEGKYFTWTAQEFRQVVAEAGEDPDAWATALGVTEIGNFEGRTILSETSELPDRGERWQRVRAALQATREQRVAPALDDKVLTSWNGLIIGALAEAGAALGRWDYVEAARAAARFVASELVVGDRLQHTWRADHGPSVPALAEDLALLADGLLRLYEADFDPEWVRWARELAADCDARFPERDESASPTGRYHATPDDGEALIARPVEFVDNAVPSATSVMAQVHLRLHALTGEPTHAEAAERALAAGASFVTRAPSGFGELLVAMEAYLAGPVEVAVVGDGEAGVLLDPVRERWRPGVVVAATGGDGSAAATAVPLLAGREPVGGHAAAYVCRNFACDAPVTDPDALRAQLDGA